MQVGDYVRGRREGYGVYVFPNGDRYEGECSGDLPDGHGVYRFQVSGAVCEGTWRAGAKHGWFVITVGCKQSCGALLAWLIHHYCSTQKIVEPRLKMCLAGFQL